MKSKIKKDVILMNTAGSYEKQSNTSRILRYIFRNKTVSRAEISENLGISPALVTASVSVLIKKGIVEDMQEFKDNLENTPGRKRLLIGINANYIYSVGVEFSQNAYSFCLTNLAGKIIAKSSLHPSGDDFANITQCIIKHTEALIKESGISKDQIIGIGIAVPGHMSEDNGHLISLSHLFDSFSPDRISQATGLTTVCENNVRSMAYGQYLFHASVPESFVLVHVGAGIFCANVVDGKMVIGRSYTAGEIGHTIVNKEGTRCECGKYGCLQTYASESWLLKRAEILFNSSSSTMLHQLVQQSKDITIDHILTAYQLGDPSICGYISEAIKYLGISISNIFIVIGPQKVYLHSRLLNNESIRNQLKDYVNRQLLFVQNDLHDDLEILSYNSHTAAIGASALAIDRLLIAKQ